MTERQKLETLNRAGLSPAMIRRAARNGIDIDKLIELLKLVGGLILKVLPLFLSRR